MKRLCKRQLKFGLMTEERPCLRLLGHSGYHTPDLLNMIFGKMKVVRFLGAIGKNKPVRWLVSINDKEVSIEARSLISGASSGKRLHQHGFRNTPEYNSVMNHYGVIFRSSSPQHKYYHEMPFYDGWNPRKGGELWLGAKWIIDNLGSKPGLNWSLDIVEHAIGFMPGNLRWALKDIQMRNQRHRILEKISEKEFAVEAKRRGYVRV